jgi:predicted transcriptional regulator
MHKHLRTARAAERVQKAARAHDARRLRAAGMSRLDVAERFGVNVATVSRWTKETA